MSIAVPSMRPCGQVDQTGGPVRDGSFFVSHNSCAHCRVGCQTSCQQRELVEGAQTPVLRVLLADGTKVHRTDVAAARSSHPKQVGPFSLLAVFFFLDH
jgi:hypothetical protein